MSSEAALIAKVMVEDLAMVKPFSLILLFTPACSNFKSICKQIVHTARVYGMGLYAINTSLHPFPHPAVYAKHQVKAVVLYKPPGALQDIVFIGQRLTNFHPSDKRKIKRSSK